MSAEQWENVGKVLITAGEKYSGRILTPGAKFMNDSLFDQFLYGIDPIHCIGKHQ